MRGSREFCQIGSKFDKVFLVDEGREDPNYIISGLYSPASETPLNGVSLACR